MDDGSFLVIFCHLSWMMTVFWLFSAIRAGGWQFFGYFLPSALADDSFFVIFCHLRWMMTVFTHCQSIFISCMEIRRTMNSSSWLKRQMHHQKNLIYFIREAWFFKKRMRNYLYKGNSARIFYANEGLPDSNISFSIIGKRKMGRRRGIAIFPSLVKEGL